MASVGYATLQIIPSLEGMDKAIRSGVASPAAANAAGKAGGGLGSKIMGGIKATGLAAGVAVGAAMTTALVKGWGRLTAIDDAQAKLKGLGHSAESVQTVMDSALASVKGTAFGLGDAATIAAGSVASGVKPGKDLTRTLKLVADAATIGGTSLGEMGSIFNKVAASGKIQGDVIAQLGDKGIPILQLLGKQLGKTPEEVSKLASKGKIDFETFQKAMESGLGGSALKSGDTIKGALANVGAAFGRFGEKILVGVAPVVKDVFGGFTAGLDKIGAFIEPWADKVSGAIAGVFNILFKGDFTGPFLGFEEDSGVVDFLFKIRDAVIGLPDTFKRLWDAAKPTLEALKDKTLDKARSIFEKLSDTAKTLWPAIKDVAKWAAVAVGAIAVTAWSVALDVFDALAGIIANVLAPALAGLVDWIKDNETFVLMLVAAVGAGVAAFKLWQVGAKAVVAITKAWKAAQLALSAAMNVNPIMIAVIAIAALIAAAVVAYKRVGWFREAVDKVARFFKNTFGPILKTVAGWITDTLWPALKNVGEWMADKFMGFVRGVADLWTNTLWPALQAVASFVTDTLWPALKSVGGYIADVMRPVIQGLSDTWNNALKPALNLVADILTGVIWPIFKKIGGFIKDVFMIQVDALAWVWSNVLWPAFKAVAGFISDNVLPIFQKITDKIIDVALWVGRKIGEIVGFVVGIPGRIGSIVAGLWNGLKDGITGAKNWISDTITAIVGFVTDLPGRFTRGTKNLFDGFKDAFKSALNWIIDKWNGLSFTIPGFDIPGIGKLGGNTIRVPHIPRFHTGGTVDGRFDGDEVVARLLRNETVLTPRQLASLGSAAGGRNVTVVNRFNGPVAGRSGERWVSDMTASAVRKGLKSA